MDRKAKSKRKTLDDALHAKQEIEDRLTAIEGVKGVDVGFLRRGGKPTDRIGIRVFIEPAAKRKRRSIERKIPAAFKGVPIRLIEESFSPE